MTEMPPIQKGRRRWTWCRILIVLGILLGLAFTTTELLWRDPTRDLANRVYDQLEPNMPKSQVIEIFRQANLPFDPIHNGGVCTLEGRIILEFKFNDSDQLSDKSIFEMKIHRTQPSDWITNLRWKLGLFDNPRYRCWPDVPSDW